MNVCCYVVKQFINHKPLSYAGCHGWPLCTEDDCRLSWMTTVHRGWLPAVMDDHCPLRMTAGCHGWPLSTVDDCRLSWMTTVYWGWLPAVMDDHCALRMTAGCHGCQLSTEDDCRLSLITAGCCWPRVIMGAHRSSWMIIRNCINHKILMRITYQHMRETTLYTIVSQLVSAWVSHKDVMNHIYI